MATSSYDFYGSTIEYGIYSIRSRIMVDITEEETYRKIQYVIKIETKHTNGGSGNASFSVPYEVLRNNSVVNTGTISEKTYQFTAGWTDRGTILSTQTYSVNKTHSFQENTFTFKIYMGSKSLGRVSSYDLTFNVPSLTRYYITYNTNGGTGMGREIKYYGEPYTISSYEPTRSGFVFLKWNSSSDGTGTSYSPGQIYTHNADLNLYAKWYQLPVCTYHFTRLNYYYNNASQTPITVTIKTIQAFQNATIDSCILRATKTDNGSMISLASNVLTAPGTLTINAPSDSGQYTLTITVTDSNNYSQTYSLGTVTILYNQKPTGQATTTSSAYYYGGYSTYSVNVTNATAYNNKTIKNIKLKVGTAESIVTTTSSSASLSVTVPSDEVSSTTNTKTYTPQVIITDNMDVASDSINLTNITVYYDKPPTLSTPTITSQAPYYGGVSNYSLNITATPANYKTITSVKLIVGSDSVTKTNTATGAFSTSASVSLPVVTTDTSTAVSVIATDSTGKTATSTLTSIQNCSNNAPTFSASVTSSANYYANYNGKPYKVNVSNIVCDTPKTIKEIRLDLKNSAGTIVKTVNRTTAGELSIVPPVVGSLTPIVTVTDNLNISTVKNDLAAITVYENTLPTVDTTVSSPSSIYYENTPVNTTAYTPYIVTLNNAAAGNGTKTLKEIKLTLGNVTEAASSFNNGTTITINPTVAGTFTPTVTITDYIDNNTSLIGATKTYNLSPITVNSRVINVSNITIQRIEKSTTITEGALKDEGTYGLIKATFTYSKYNDNVQNIRNYLLQPLVQYNSTNLPVTWFTNWNNGTFSGQITTTAWETYYPTSPITLYGKITNEFDFNNSYNISITPRSTALTGTAINVVLAQAFYLLAGKSGGHALGIGKKPTADGMLDIGMGKIVLNDYEGNSPAISYRLNNNISDKITFTQDGKIKIGTQLYKTGVSTNWQKGRDNALIRVTTINGYSPAISIKTTNGSWDIGSYNQSSYTDDLLFTYVTDTLYSGTNTTFTKQIKFLEDGGIKADSLISNSITVDQATLGDLIVNGNGSFANNLQVNKINGVTVGSTPKFTDNNTFKSFYGTCATEAATAAKVVNLSVTTGWQLVAGTIIGVKFTYTNTATNPTLNVAGSGAKSIFVNNAVLTSGWYAGEAGRIHYYMYDGTYWVFMGHSYDWNSTYYLQTYTTRQTDANVAWHNNSYIKYLLATSSMTSNKPTFTGDGTAARAMDGQILHLSWDNDGGWDVQLAIPDTGGMISTRGGAGKENDVQKWTNWVSYARADKAISNITRSGTTFTATRADGTTFTFTQQDNNTTALTSMTGTLGADHGGTGKTNLKDASNALLTALTDNSGTPSTMNREDVILIKSKNTTVYNQCILSSIFTALSKSDVTTALGYTPPTTNTTYSSLAAASGGTAVSLCTTGEKYTWNNKSNLAIGTTASTAAAGNHTHGLSIAADSGTNALTLAASTKYKLTAGGSTYIFTTPPNTVTTATTTGSGNAVTAISASNGALTITKGTTFIAASIIDADGESKSNVNVQTSTPTAVIDHIFTTAGTYIITGTANFSSNSTGTRYMNLAQTSGSTWQVTKVPGASTTVALTFTWVFELGANAHVYLNVYHSAGTSLTVNAEMRWCRIK